MLDPDFAAGKRAIMAGDWQGVIEVLTSAGLRDDRNADIQNYLGYAHRRLRQLDTAMRHYRQALTLNPRHRSAHEHLGEAYLMQGNLAKAEEQLAALEKICRIARKNRLRRQEPREHGHRLRLTQTRPQPSAKATRLGSIETCLKPKALGFFDAKRA